MLASAIVIFREMLEIVLIVGIILAATREIPGRFRWIVAGFAGGISASIVVAVFTDVISEFAEGVGQEVFNAAILFTAAFFIGWTVLWMSRHAREMKTHFKRVGDAIVEGKLPYYSLSFVIALAILREGSEIVLFSYGMLASGQSASVLLAGGLLGGCAGVALGLLIYFGLIALPARYFLRVTSWLLVLLVAGLMSQGVGFLLAAGYLEGFSAAAWDSSWLLSDEGVMGKSLQALLGYTAKPAWAQLLIYILTLSGLIMLLRLYSGSRNVPIR